MFVLVNSVGLKLLWNEANVCLVCSLIDDAIFEKNLGTSLLS